MSGTSGQGCAGRSVRRDHRTLVAAILERVARKLGIEMLVEPEWGYVGQIRLPDGRTRYFRNANFDLNGQGASEVARDKAYAEFFLRHLGYPTIEGRAFFTRRWAGVLRSRRGPALAYRYAKRLGFPVIIKPNSRSQGYGVSKVWNRRDLEQAIHSFEKTERVYLVQRFVTGHDYRIVVLDGRVISAYERLPLSVTGDGHSTIRQLLARKQGGFTRISRDTQIKPDDPRIRRELHRQGATVGSVPASGKKVRLLTNANLSTGGDAVDVTDSVHPQWKALARRIGRDMNLRYIGIDVLSQVTIDRHPLSYVVIEINSAPGLDHYALIGRKQMHLVEDLYAQVLRALLK